MGVLSALGFPSKKNKLARQAAKEKARADKARAADGAAAAATAAADPHAERKRKEVLAEQEALEELERLQALEEARAAEQAKKAAEEAARAAEEEKEAAEPATPDEAERQDEQVRPSVLERENAAMVAADEAIEAAAEGTRAAAELTDAAESKASNIQEQALANAATAVQAVVRRKLAVAGAKQEKVEKAEAVAQHEQDALQQEIAATDMQAAVRGHLSRSRTQSRNQLSESSDIFGDDPAAHGKVIEASSPRASVASLDSVADLRWSIASADLEGASTPQALNESESQSVGDENGEERARGLPGLFCKCLPWKKEGASEHHPDEDTDNDDDDPFAGATAEALASRRTADPTPKKDVASAPILCSYKSSVTPEPEAKLEEQSGPRSLRCLKCFRGEPALVEPVASPPSGYLLFSEINGGSFQLQWSTEAEEGALARFMPGSPVPDFNLTENGGRSELCRGVGGLNVKGLYRGWVSFIKLAHRHEATFYFLSNLEKQPVALYFATGGLSVRRLAEGEIISFDGVRAVAAVGLYADGLDVLTMETQLFLSVGQKLGFSMALQGGAAGVGGVPDVMIELSSERSRRSSFSEEQIAVERALSGPEREHVLLSPSKMRRLSQTEQDRAAARAAEAELQARANAEEAALASLRMPGSSLPSPRSSQDGTQGVSPMFARNLSGLSPRINSPLVISPRFSSARNSLCSFEELQSLKVGMASAREATALKEEEERSAAEAAKAAKLAQEQALIAKEEAAILRAATSAAAREERAQCVRGMLDWLKCVPKKPAAVEEAPALPRGFLLFSEANGGCFQLQWSRTPVDEALASFLPKSPVPESKLTTNCGLSELCRSNGGPDVKSFYRGWASFIKLAHRHEATFCFLSNLEKQPVALYFATGGLTVQRLAEGETFSFDRVRAVAVVGLNADGLNVQTMETQFFISVGLRLGFSLALEGGAAGVGGVTDDKVELNTDRSKRPSLGTPRRRSFAAEEEAPKEVVEVPREPWWSGFLPSWLKADAAPLAPLPPPPMGYLVFSETNGGCFQLHWSTEHVDGALARFLPKKPVPDFKLSANGGRSELCRDIGGPNVKNFYRGWVSYITLSRKYEASFCFLSNLEKQPVALYFATEGLSVKRLLEGETISVDHVRGVAAVGLNAVGLNVRSMETQFFLSVGGKLGVSVSFVEAAPALESPRLRMVPRSPAERSRSPSPDQKKTSTAMERAEQPMRV